MLVSTATASVKSNTRSSIRISCERGRKGKAILPSMPILHQASAIPSPPPKTESNRPSARNCWTNRRRPAPSAMRMLISRRRTVARASSKLATLVQAISSTKPTATIIITSVERTFATHRSSIWVRRMPRPFLYCASSRCAIAFMLSRACASVTPDLSLPITRNLWLSRAKRSVSEKTSGDQISTVRYKADSSGGITPTIVYCCPFRGIVWLIMFGFAAKLRRQSSLLSTTTRSLPATSSPGKKARPRVGLTPSTSK